MDRAAQSGINKRKCAFIVKSCEHHQSDCNGTVRSAPKFDFWATLVCVGQITVIFVSVLVVLCLLRWLMGVLGFTVSFERVFGSSVPVLEAAVWPFFILIGVCLFKDNLEGLADLIDRACHGNQGAIQPANGAKKEDDESAENGKNMNNDSRESQNRMYRAFENYALERLQQEEGVLIQHHARVFDPMYAFDGAFEKGGLVYIVEVKVRVDREPLRRFLLHVDRIYNGLSRTRRKCLRTLVCISMNEGEKGVANALRKLSALREEVSVPVEFRFYSFDYREQQEIKA